MGDWNIRSSKVDGSPDAINLRLKRFQFFQAELIVLVCFTGYR